MRSTEWYMKQISLSVVFVLAAVGCASAQQKTRAYAGAQELADQCRKASGIIDNNGKLRKKSETDTGFAAGQCSGYIQGLLDGIDGTDYSSSGKTFTIRVEYISNNWDVVTAFLNDLTANPLDKNKTAQEVLLKVLVNNGLVASIEKPKQIVTTSEQ